jgi:uncharacterized protein
LAGSVPIAMPIGSVLVGGATTALWLFTEYVVNKLTEPSPRASLRWGFTPFETGVTWEDVAVPATDGSRMPGWLLVRGPDAPAILACGGHRGKRSDLLGISSALWRAGFNVLLFDYRGYGVEPDRGTLGYRELSDARAALQFLRERFPQAPLGVVGFSMGASIAIMLASREPDVCCVLADSPFTSQREIVRYRVRQAFRLKPKRWTAVLGNVLMDLVNRRLHARFAYRMDDVHPLQDVARLAPRALLLVHGEQDQAIPPEHSRRIAAVAQGAGVALETWFVARATHCEAYFLDRRGYCERAAAFFGRYLMLDGAMGRQNSPVGAPVHAVFAE